MHRLGLDGRVVGGEIVAVGDDASGGRGAEAEAVHGGRAGSGAAGAGAVGGAKLAHGFASTAGLVGFAGVVAAAAGTFV